MSRAETLAPLGATLRHMAQELAEARALAVRLEALVATLARHVGASDRTDCQAADMLVQRLEGLAVYAGALAADAPDEAVIDAGRALRGLSLSDQARRLAGLEVEPAPSGDLTLFID
jgi:hypothetical protein